MGPYLRYNGAVYMHFNKYCSESTVVQPKTKRNSTTETAKGPSGLEDRRPSIAVVPTRNTLIVYQRIGGTGSMNEESEVDIAVTVSST